MKTKVVRMLGVVWLGVGSLALLLSPLSAQEPKLLSTLKGHTDWVYTVAFNPDGKTLASGSRDETIKLWDVVAGKEKATIKGHMDGVSSMAFSPDGKTLASGSRDGTIKLWDVAKNK